MHAFSPHRHHSAGEASDKETKGLLGSGGWRYDLHEWLTDIFVFRGKVRELRQKTANLAQLQPGEMVLDVGCGTGTLVMEVARRVGRAGRVAGIDPGSQQIARARAKAARRNAPIEFHIGVIEQLAFPDQTFDVVLSTLMMHHLPAPLKRQGLAEIASGGALVVLGVITALSYYKPRGMTRYGWCKQQEQNKGIAAKDAATDKAQGVVHEREDNNVHEAAR